MLDSTFKLGSLHLNSSLTGVGLLELLNHFLEALEVLLLELSVNFLVSTCLLAILIGDELVVVKAVAETKLGVNKELLDALIFKELLAVDNGLFLLDELLPGLTHIVISLLLGVKGDSDLSVVDEGLGPSDVASVFAAEAVVLVGGHREGTDDLHKFSLVVLDIFLGNVCYVGTAELEHELLKVLEVEFNIDIGGSLIVTEESNETCNSSNERRVVLHLEVVEKLLVRCGIKLGKDSVHLLLARCYIRLLRVKGATAGCNVLGDGCNLIF
jgi:hypothetical protein